MRLIDTIFYISNVSKEDKDKQLNQFRELINTGTKEETIIQIMNISRPTYFRLKKRIIMDIVKQHVVDPSKLEVDTAYYRNLD